METKLPSMPRREQLLRRVRGEYLEMPGLKLTCLQAQRLWAMDEQTCVEILTSLTEARFLQQQHDGTYARLVDGPVAFPAPRMARAERPHASTRAARLQ
jgi:hypothetical protein